MTHINAISKTLRPTRFPSVLQCALSRQYSTDAEQEIVIPKRIQRGPTDVLRALSRTVNRDPTAPHYKYHDDPYLIPASNYSKRSFSLAQESGRKAARWILEEHADLFQHQVADPFIEAFAPKQLITEESQIDVESLSKAISQLNVTDAVTIFQVLQKKSVAVAKEDLQRLLELVCFYNAEDKSEEDWIEERWFKQGARDRVRQRKTWKDGGVAETIFLGIDPPNAKSLSTLLVGMASYGQLDNAWKYYNEAKSKNIILHVNSYNALIKSSGFVKEQHEARWNLVKELLEEMNSNQVAPNVGTLNAVLEMLSGMASHRNSKTYALSVIAEFRQLGVQPSLASYYYLINLYCRDRTKTSGILIDIMNQLEGKTFVAQDPKDTFFFFTAMEISNVHLSDVNLANKINDLLLTGDNYNLIGDSYKESLYHRNYFMLKCEYDAIEDFMAFYESYVPSIYVPEPVVMEAILKGVDMNGATKYLPKLWSDMILFDHVTRESLVSLFVETLYRNPVKDDEILANKLADTAESIYTKIEEQNNEAIIRRNPVSWTGSMLGHLMGVFLQADRFVKACMILTKLDREMQRVLGVPEIRPLTAFVDYCIKRKDADNAIWCVQYCFDAGYEETQSLGDNIYSKLKLSDNQLSRLKTIVNLDAVPENTN